MTQNYIAALDTNPANNTDFIGVGVLGSDLVSTADNAFRANGGILARFYDDFGGVNTVGGTGNAITITTPSTYTAYATGIRLRFIASAANSGAVTVNVDAVGAKAIRKISGGTDVALATGDILAAVGYEIVYSTAANAAAGAWVMLNPDLSGSRVLTPSGSAAAPAVAISSPFDTGFYASLAGQVDVSIGGTAAFSFLSTGLTPFSDDLQPLGLASKSWADLFLATGGVINWKNDVRITHSTDALAFTGAANGYSFDALLNLSGAAAGQISFPAAQNASSNANTLDDYEEGTSTPTPTSDGGAFTSASSALTNTKIGNRVFVDGVITITTVGGGSGAVIITLPYTPNANGVLVVRNASSGITGTAQVSSGSGTAFMRPYDGTSFIAAGASLNISGHYRTA